jgi:hypothetical protein
MDKRIVLITAAILVALTAGAIVWAKQAADNPTETTQLGNLPDQASNSTRTENSEVETNRTNGSSNSRGDNEINPTAQSAGSIKLLSPNGGSYLLGSKVSISWETSSSSETVISLVDSTGLEVGIITYAKAGQQEYTWYPGTVTKNGQQIPIKGDSFYKIRIASRNSSDLSDSVFELSYGGPPQSQ